MLLLSAIVVLSLHRLVEQPTIMSAAVAGTTLPDPEIPATKTLVALAEALKTGSPHGLVVKGGSMVMPPAQR
jgi:hypothetical protein